MIVRPPEVQAIRLNPSTGLPEMNPDRYRVQTWKQGCVKNEVQSIAALATGEDTVQVAAEKGLSGDFEVVGFNSWHLGAYRALLYLGGGTNKRFMNVPIHVDFLAATAQLPFYIPFPLLIEARSGLNVQFTNLCGITNKIRFVAQGRRFLDYLPGERERLLAAHFTRREWPFWLGLDSTTVTLSANQVGGGGLLSVPSDGDLEAEYLFVKAQGPYRLTLYSNQSNTRPIMIGGGTPTVGTYESAAASSTCLYAYRLSGFTGIFKRQDKLNAVFDDLSGLSNTVEMALVGRICDYPEGADLPPVPLPPTATAIAGTIPQPIQGLGAFNPHFHPAAALTPPTRLAPPVERRPWFS